jgi:hypothetical protein
MGTHPQWPTQAITLTRLEPGWKPYYLINFTSLKNIHNNNNMDGIMERTMDGILISDCISILD